MHDLRHEGLSWISEVGHATNPYFNVFDLQAISGHLDIASLARYINPKPRVLTKRLNASFAEAGDFAWMAGTAPISPAIGPADCTAARLASLSPSRMRCIGAFGHRERAIGPLEPPCPRIGTCDQGIKKGSLLLLRRLRRRSFTWTRRKFGCWLART